ncbi:peptidylprolyl isomerase [Aliidiomarina maris]|uniref:Peptidyl-prolyl cis-trans isomerase n=2 Tax=Aliidiomarina maris TaxID=531312 RepID=A0A327X7K6_9GAMM|nr:peptidyl-prolyl cis-trans isomerase A (cyclophilin A) [Aliidiomarina maris]RUO28672.1 peptidylprolyl isomerase [Aliidiomarina maris]
MRNKLYPLFAALLLSVLMPVKAQDIQQNNLFPRVKFVTEHGEMVVELDRMRAPLTVDNFLRYVVAGDYNNTLFHRVVEDFVVQGGGYKADDSPLRTRDPVVNESGNGLTNQFATIAMARERNPHSASSQFYFNVKDNDSLNPSSRRWGYAVFGRVVENDALLHELASVETHTDPDTQADDVPVQPLRLIRVQLLPRE